MATRRSRVCSTAAMRQLWARPERFRKTVEMERYRFGRGEYRYFARPMLRRVLQLRRGLYPCSWSSIHELSPSHRSRS